MSIFRVTVNIIATGNIITETFISHYPWASKKFPNYDYIFYSQLGFLFQNSGCLSYLCLTSSSKINVHFIAHHKSHLFYSGSPSIGNLINSFIELFIEHSLSDKP